MGVAGLMEFLRTQYADCFVQQPPRAEHVYLDMNSLLHDATRKGKNEAEAISRVQRLLQDLTRRYAPQSDLVLATDGPAPLAKLHEQRDRRVKRGAKEEASGVSGLNVTVGTALKLFDYREPGNSLVMLMLAAGLAPWLPPWQALAELVSQGARLWR